MVTLTDAQSTEGKNKSAQSAIEPKCKLILAKSPSVSTKKLYLIAPVFDKLS